jgi:hypothetical protein
MKSKCCQTPIKNISGNEGTGYMMCTKCLISCDIMEDEAIRYMDKINNLSEALELTTKILSDESDKTKSLSEVIDSQKLTHDALLKKLRGI